MKSGQNLNTVKQNFESTECFKGSGSKRLKVAEVDLLAHLSSGERTGAWASCFYFSQKTGFDISCTLSQQTAN